MKTFLTIARPSQVETITARQPYARPQRPHGKKGEYKRKGKFGNKFD